MAYPKSLTVISENFDGGPAFVAKNEHITAKRVGFQLDPAQAGQPDFVKKRGAEAGTEWFSSTLVMYGNVVLYADGKTLAALSAEDGTELWNTPCEAGVNAPVDVFVAGGLVWVGTSDHRKGPDFTEGRDPSTGEVKRAMKGSKISMHHRCYRAKATDRYILWGRGVRFNSVEEELQRKRV